MTLRAISVALSVLLAVLCAVEVNAATGEELLGKEEFAFKEGYDPLYNQMRDGSIKTQAEMFERERLNLQEFDRILKEVNTPATTIKPGATRPSTAAPARLNGLAQPGSGSVSVEKGSSAEKSGTTTMQSGAAHTASGSSSTVAGKGVTVSGAATTISGAGSTVSGTATAQSGSGSVMSGRANPLPKGTGDTTASGDAVLARGNVSLPSARQLTRDEVIARLSRKMNQVEQTSNAANNAAGARQSKTYESMLDYIKAMKDQTEKNYPTLQSSDTAEVPHNDAVFYKKVIGVLRNNH